MYYDPTKELTIQCDASGKGLGAALLQNECPIAYASRPLTDTETCYASIGKEMLDVVFALVHFYQYTFGRQTRVINDHKPLEVIVKKPLVKGPSVYVYRNMTLISSTSCQGKYIYLANTLLRAVASQTSSDRSDFKEVNMVTYLPIR